MCHPARADNNLESTSENYTSIYVSLNIKRHKYVSYTTYNLFKKIIQYMIFLLRHNLFLRLNNI